MTKQTKLILIIVIVLVLLIALGVGGYFYFKKKNQKANSTQTSTTNADDFTAVPEEQAQNGAGWKIFKNFAESYLIEYPSDATVENNDNPATPANGAKCVKISTKYVWVRIASRNIPTDMPCITTSFGTEWSNAPDEQVTAAGPTYTAKGMIFQSASMGTYADDYTITTSSGDKIEYGIGVSDNDSGTTKAQAKDLVHKMVASFSPAE